MAACASTTFSLLPLAVTDSLSRPTTATTANVAPVGFQHLLQPQAWLKATSLASVTSTGSLAHLQWSLPPLKPLVPGLTPLSTDGWIFTAMMFPLGSDSESNDAADRLALVHQVEGVVDLRQRHHMRNQVVDVDLA